MFERPKSHKDLGYILGGSALSALLFLLAPFFIGFANFIVLPLLCLGLGRDSSSQFYASILTTLALMLFTSIQVGLLLSFISIIPAMLFGYLALLSRQDSNGAIFWYPLGRLISDLTGYILGLCMIFSALFLNAGYKTVLRNHLLQMMPSHLPVLYTPDQIISILPAVLAISTMLMTLINGTAAQMILVKRGENQRPTPPVTSIKLSWWVWIALCLCGLSAFLLKGDTAQFFINAALVLLFSFLFEGLGVIHTLFSHYKPEKIFLWIFYIIMILFGWPILIVIALGIFEPWLKLRKRLVR